jgi:hypothetical protein
MSRPYPSKELPKPDEMGGLLDQLEESERQTYQAPLGQPNNGNGLGTKVRTSPRAQAVTYRSRLYRYQCEGLAAGEYMYTLVTDTLENPVTSKLPPGEMLFEVRDSSPETLKQRMRSKRQELGRVEITNWRTFGSI